MCDLPRCADNRLYRHVTYSFMHSLRCILFNFIYMSQNIYLHKNVEICVLGDIKLYISNNCSNLACYTDFQKLEQLQKILFYLDIWSIVIIVAQLQQKYYKKGQLIISYNEMDLSNDDERQKNG
jgi:hypothetical protein